MKGKGCLMMALAVVLCFAPSQAQEPSLVLGDGGLAFPDGTVQMTAAASEVNGYFAATIEVAIGEGSAYHYEDIYDVQSGYTAVVEYVSVWCATPIENPIGRVSLESVRVGGPQVSFYIPIHSQGQTATSQLYAGGLMVRVYGTGYTHGDYFRVNVTRITGSGDSSCFFSISGRRFPN